jgi:hypothetical protein
MLVASACNALTLWVPNFAQLQQRQFQQQQLGGSVMPQ